MLSGAKQAHKAQMVLKLLSNNFMVKKQQNILQVGHLRLDSLGQTRENHLTKPYHHANLKKVQSL